ncbi:MAG: hypothetical protein IPN08_13905 [Bacteroidales bacterium]|nr:hypothetical protein [Bacteroidales bacterium]MBK9358462.1 hypothetical protein [Bacteroidales bacterium]
MNALKNFSVLFLLLSLGFTTTAREYGEEKLNLPGDNLNLYAVMKLFQESETLEGFESDLNAEDSKINNLDLNGDDRIDYIKVIDYVDGETHSIVLQVAVNPKENQDVAVFTVYKDSRGNVQVQLVGDEYLYGKDYIIEPYYADGSTETPNPGYAGDTRVVEGETVVIKRTTYVEVQSWPVVRYIYLPTYSVWHSPYYWGYYPVYWNPWRPYYWDYYYGYHSHWNHHYHGYYRHCSHYRYPRYHDYYYNGHRAHSVTVHAYRENGRYRDTYSRPDLRREGSAEFTRRHGDESRGNYRSDAGRTGRTASDVRRDNGHRDATPGVNNRSTKPSTRESAVRGDNKSTGRTGNDRSVRSSDNNRSSKPAVRETSVRGDNKSTGRTGNDRSVKPSDNNRSSKPNARETSVRGDNKPTGRSDNNKAVKPSGNNRSSKPSARPASSQGSSKASGKTGRTSGQTGKSGKGDKKSNGR